VSPKQSPWYRRDHLARSIYGCRCTDTAAAAPTELSLSVPSPGAPIRQSGRTALAKGQRRGTREAKKPKADKKKLPAPAPIFPLVRAKSK
jgi:hypothetical protein